MDCAHTDTSEFPIKGYWNKGGKPTQKVIYLIDSSLDALELSILARSYLVSHHLRHLNSKLEVCRGWRCIVQFTFKEEFSAEVPRLYVHLSAELHEISNCYLLFCVTHEEDFRHVGCCIVTSGRLLQTMKASFVIRFLAQVMIFRYKVIRIGIVYLYLGLLTYTVTFSMSSLKIWYFMKYNPCCKRSMFLKCSI